MSTSNGPRRVAADDQDEPLSRLSGSYGFDAGLDFHILHVNEVGVARRRRRREPAPPHEATAERTRWTEAIVRATHTMDVPFAWCHYGCGEVVLVFGGAAAYANATTRAAAALAACTGREWRARTVSLPSMTEVLNFVLWRQCVARMLVAEAFARNVLGGGARFERAVWEARRRGDTKDDGSDDLRVFGVSMRRLLANWGHAASQFALWYGPSDVYGACILQKSPMAPAPSSTDHTLLSRCFVTDDKRIFDFCTLAAALPKRLLHTDDLRDDVVALRRNGAVDSLPLHGFHPPRLCTRVDGGACTVARAPCNALVPVSAIAAAIAAAAVASYCW